MSLYIEFNLHFEDPILFQEFLPEVEEDFLEFETDDNKHVIRVFLSDRTSQLSPLSMIKDETNLIGHNNINCFGLTVCIEVKKPNEAIIDALKTEQNTEELKIFVREIFDLAVKVRNGLVNYFRNEEMIYYIQPMTPYSYEYVAFLTDAKVYWSFQDIACRKFPNVSYADVTIDLPLESRVQGPDITLEKEVSVDRHKWKNLATTSVKHFVETDGRGSKMYHVLIANAYWNLQQQNYRLAVVEAVIALENILNQLPDIILKLANENRLYIEENDLKKLLNDAGLRAVTQIILKAIRDFIGLDINDIKNIIKAIECRNNIVHNARRSVELAEANRYVASIHRLIYKLENFQ